jgi:hypothetical protein
LILSWGPIRAVSDLADSEAELFELPVISKYGATPPAKAEAVTTCPVVLKKSRLEVSFPDDSSPLSVFMIIESLW